MLIAVNFVIIYLVILLINNYRAKLFRSGLEEKEYSSFLKILRYWYGIALILISFKEVYYIIHSLNLSDWDLLFIKLDYYIFKVNPTQWVYKFANPYLTEFLQLIYAYYYLMIIVFGIGIYRQKKYDVFEYVLLVVFTGFFLNYLLYLIFPANGPRFHLHDFYSISKELPGISLTEPIRYFLNFGESIPPGVSNPQDFVQRDAMPSLHAGAAFLIAYLSYKVKSKSFYFYLPYFFLMLIATVYLRYHYVVDLFAGILIAIIAIIIANTINKKTVNANT